MSIRFSGTVNYAPQKDQPFSHYVNGLATLYNNVAQMDGLRYTVSLSTDQFGKPSATITTPRGAVQDLEPKPRWYFLPAESTKAFIKRAVSTAQRSAQKLYTPLGSVEVLARR